MKKTSAKNTKGIKAFPVKPLGDRLIIKEDLSKEEKTASGIYIPDTAKEDKGSKRGRVVAVGIGRYEDGKLIPINVSVGDEVLFGWGDKILVEKEEYYVVRESEIIGTIK